MPKKKGFTLVELIVVILLVGIMASYAASRYLGKSSFSAYTYSEAVVSVIRQVQVNRMQSNISDLENSPNVDYFTLYIGSKCIGSVHSCTNLQNENRSDFVLLDDSMNAVPPLNKVEVEVEFDLLGNPVGGAVDIEIQDNGNEVERICINSQGYVYTGVCS